MNAQSLTQVIKNQAHHLGFQLVGITTPTPPTHLDIYSNWLENGYHATMAWMATDRARQRRADPLKILPDCKSILVLGVRYPAPMPHHGLTIPKARVASYAWGEDYHNVIPERLRRIVMFIQEQTGEEISNRWYTDTGPILERELAQRAGLGWIGKNSCLINPLAGSYFLLAEIFLGIELQVDQPLTIDYCGTCTRCIDSCPTACITSQRTIDSNRCISYLTIEHKGFIPEHLRSRMGTWIFGCDVCQIVCPWNQKFASDHFDHAFTARSGIPPVNLFEELGITPEEFNQKFKGNPIKRTKRRGYLRNIAVALGNMSDRTAVPALSAALNDPEALIRGHAAWALGQIGGDKARLALLQAIKREPQPEVAAEIKEALQKT